MSNCDFSQAQWKKARRCASANCVEVAETPGVVGVRDSKNPGGPVLRIPANRWVAFLDGVKQNEFNRP